MYYLFVTKYHTLTCLQLRVIDNSGALIVECIQVLKGSKHGGIGDEIVCVVKKARPASTAAGSGNQNVSKVKRGEVRRALIVRTKKETARGDGRYIRFDDNACVMINNKGEPLGTRILGIYFYFILFYFIFLFWEKVIYVLNVVLTL